MKNGIRSFCFLFLVFFSSAVLAQQSSIDSLTALLNAAKFDTAKANIMLALAELINDDEWKRYNSQALAIAEKNIPSASNPELKSFLRIKATAYNNIGFDESTQGNLSNALDYYSRSLKIDQQIGNYYDIGYILNNIADIYETQGNIPRALEYYDSSLKMHEKTKNKQGIAQAYNNIGFVNSTQGDLDKALDYYEKSLKIKKALNDASGIAVSLSNVGYIYMLKKQNYKAMGYYLLALKAAKDIQDKGRMALIYSNIGGILQKEGNTDEALYNYLRGLRLSEEIGDADGVSHYMYNVGALYLVKGRTDSALFYGNKSMKIAKEMGAPDLIKLAAELLKDTYKAKGDPGKALEYAEEYFKMHDSINSETTRKATYKQLLSYEFDKKEALSKVQQEKKDVENAAAIKRQRIITWSVGLGLLMVLIFSVSLYKRFLLTQKQKKIIEEQKKTVDEKNTAILDSIVYAKRLQDAILPPIKMVKQYLPQSFVLFKPKDIVAGDFYWLEQLDDLILFAAADCTGHGVPGAMVSVVCSNALNRTVKEFGIKEPAKILDKVRELVVETFEKSESEVKDGMDISLCCFNKKTNELQWCGANNPLWIIQQGNELLEFKANKQPIGKADVIKPFTAISFPLKEQDTLYIFTDGYADQFGLSAEERMKQKQIIDDSHSSNQEIESARALLSNGKKFKYAQLKATLLAIQHLPMEEQSLILDKKLAEWKGNLEQVDDILIIGIRI